MSVTQLHGLEAIKFDVNDATTGVLSGITEESVIFNNTLSNTITDGDVYSRFNSLANQKIAAKFGCIHIDQALNLCGLTGLRISATGGMKTGMVLYRKKQAEGGARATGNNHDTHTIKEGILVPRRLVAEHGGDAKIEYDALATWDKTNDPLVIATGVALPTNPNTPSRFSLAPISLGIDEAATLFTQCRNLEVDFGLAANTEGADGDYWDTFARIAEAMPTITMRGVNKDWLSASKIPLTGANLTHAGCSILLMKRAQGGTFVAGDVAEHILITCAGMATIEEPWNARGNAPGETTLKITMRYDGTNLPIVVDTTYAFE